MRIFIDTANIDEIKAAKKLGILDGCTTNPSLIAREKIRSYRKFREIVKSICEECEDLPVSIEVLKVDAEGMITEGRELAKIARNVIVKLPCTEAGLRACKQLSSENIKTNLTLCFSLSQALLVAKAGATYVSPFVGRLEDIGLNGLELIADIRNVYNIYGISTKILGASIRNSQHIANCARIGVDIVTIPFAVVRNLMEHHLTTKGLETFLEDARKANSNPNEV